MFEGKASTCLPNKLKHMLLAHKSVGCLRKMSSLCKEEQGSRQPHPIKSQTLEILKSCCAGLVGKAVSLLRTANDNWTIENTEEDTVGNKKYM